MTSVGENERIAKDCSRKIGILKAGTIPTIMEALTQKDAEWGKKVNQLEEEVHHIRHREAIDHITKRELQSRLAIADKLAEALREIASGGFSNYVMVESAKEVLSLWEQGKKD